ncbi:hypothetical protein [Sphingomonas sp. KR3-1]|uniref:hypothetical protein n=1 Tax=Sphingomonas sp. KR3-1 TaxID=3156611 RepID=UPI0032B5B7A7
MSRRNASSALGLSAGLLALASGLAASPAHASDECGPQTGTTVTCTSATNPNSAGITYAATQNLTLKIAPDVVVDTTATHARGLTIGGTRNTSNVEIDAAGSTIVTAGAAAATVATGTGNLTLSFGTIKTSGDNAAGINAASASGNVSASAQSIATTGAGATAMLLASTSGSVAVTDYGTISTTGATAYGISARGVGVAIDGKGSIGTTGANATAVLVTATTGDTRLNLGAITTAGINAVGVNATSTTGNIAVSAQSVTTTGSGATAILTSSTSGAISVTNSGPISTGGASAYGIYARGPAGVTVGGRGSITTTGASATAVLIASTAGDIALDLGAIQTSGDNAPGVNAASSAGNIAVSAQSVTTTGAGSSAILAQATAGTASVANAGAISTTGATAYGIYARGAAGVTITGQGSITTKGDGANAIDVISAAGAVDVTQGSVSTAGKGAIGIRVSATKDARVTVGSVSTAGVDAIGISALSSTGAATVSLTGAVRSAASIGVAINAKTSAALNLVAGASLDGGLGAVSIASVTGAMINNAGTIGPSGTAKLAAVTITATGGPVTINNSGTINGNLLLGAGNDVVTNTGVFNAVANSDFKGGTDLFDNRGAFNVAPSAAAATTVTLTGLESFRNAGVIDFRNGHAGDQLVVPGDYAGVNGRMIVDIDPTNLTGSDLIQVSGTASGTTIVSLNRINDGTLALNYGTPFMKVGAASDAGAFTLDPAEQNASGLIGFGIKYDAGNLSYDLVAMPGDAAYRTLAISAGVRNLWAQSADAWSARMQQIRDLQLLSSGQSKPGIWGQFIGQRQTRDVSQTATAFGVTRPVRIGYAQNEVGGQLGIDLRSSLDGKPVYGITGGYLHSTLSYDSQADRARFDDVNLGAYVGFRSGALFFNLLGKYDLYWGHVSSVSGGYSSKLKGSGYGVQAELGGRLGGKALFLEPHVSVAANHGRIDDFAVTAGRFRFDDPDGLTLKAGGRVGSSFAFGAGAKGTVFIRGDYVDNVMGKDRVVFSSGGTNAALQMDATSPYGEGAIGMTFAGKSGFGLSLEGRYAKGGDTDGLGGRITLSTAF